MTNGVQTQGSNNVISVNPPALIGEHCDINLPFPRDPTYRRTADAEMKLATGGPLGSTQQNLWVISATATDEATGQPIAFTNISIGRFGHLDSDGNLYVVLPDNDPDDIPVYVPGNKNYTFTLGAREITMVHEVVHPALTDANLNRTNLGVGEQVNFHFSDDSIVATWNETAGSMTLNASTGMYEYEAPDTAQKVDVTPTVNGVELPKITFNVLEPTGFDPVHTRIVSTFTNIFDKGIAEARMQINVYMQPTDVSFYNVWMEEVGEDATNITDYFTDTNLFTTNPAGRLSHKGGFNTTLADYPFQLDSNNLWESGWDTCDSGPLSVNSVGNWSPGGSFTWNIPWKWGVGSHGNITHLMTNGWQQVFTVDSNGKVTITKFNNLTVTRDTNNVVVPSL